MPTWPSSHAVRQSIRWRKRRPSGLPFCVRFNQRLWRDRLIRRLQHSIQGLWLKATPAGFAPARHQTISSPHVHAVVLSFSSKRCGCRTCSRGCIIRGVGDQATTDRGSSNEAGSKGTARSERLRIIRGSALPSVGHVWRRIRYRESDGAKRARQIRRGEPRGAANEAIPRMAARTHG